MELYHNSFSSAYRYPFGAVLPGTEVQLSAVGSPDVVACTLLLHQDGQAVSRLPMTRSAENRWTCSVTVPASPCLLWYHFEAQSPKSAVSFGAGRQGMGGKCAPGSAEDYQITVYEASPTPDWFRSGLVYQIFPDRFCRGSDYTGRAADFLQAEHSGSARRVLQADWDDIPYYTKSPDGHVTRWPFFGGTLQGIAEKLPYLQSLGVTVLYLNPIFQAASNHRYDTGNYRRIDPLLGDLDSFRSLAEQAHALGIRLILDGVFSHTGADSIYFDKFGVHGGGACSGAGSPYYEWYRFEHFPDRYECWWGVEDLPNVDELNSSYQQFICGTDGVVPYWLRQGADGWRLDVADELPDAFIRSIRKACLDTKPDSLLMGEVWEDASNKISYGCRREYFFGRELQSTMNYPFRDGVIRFLTGEITAEEYCLRMMTLMEHYPPENFYGALNLIGSHDRARILNVLSGAERPEEETERQYFRLSPAQYARGAARLRLAALLQFASPGVPCIYYGDEAGMQGWEDPYNRGPFPWGREDPALLAHYRCLGALRKKHSALVQGRFLPLFCGENVLAVVRENEEERLVLLINRDEESIAEIPLPDSGAPASDLLSGAVCEGFLSLPPLGACLLPWPGALDFFHTVC